jgi:hypothetical protein
MTRRLIRFLRNWLAEACFGPYCVRCEARHGLHDRELCDVLVADQERELFRIASHHPGGLP